MADDFKKVGLSSREWGRKVRKAMKRIARSALKRALPRVKDAEQDAHEEKQEDEVCTGPCE